MKKEMSRICLISLIAVLLFAIPIALFLHENDTVISAELERAATYPGAPILMPDGSVSAPSLAFQASTTTGLYSPNADQIGVVVAGAAKALFYGNVLWLENDAATIQFGAAQDVELHRESGNVLSQRLGTNAQQFKIFETYTDGSNYENYALIAGSDQLDIQAQTAGTGTDNLNIALTPAGTGVIKHIQSDAAAVAGTAAIKTFFYNKSLAADTNDACGVEVDCITLPIPTTAGYLIITGSTNGHMTAIVANDGTSTVIGTPSGVEYQAAIGSCTDLCLHDGGANAVIFNDTAGTKTVNVAFFYN